MKPTVRLLLVEDNENDALLLTRQLEKAGFSLAVRRVDNPTDLKDSLDRESWDAVIADFNLPQFDAFSALSLVRRRDSIIPFLVVSGQIGEETAVELMKAGANDAVMKANLLRLGPALEREIQESLQRKALAEISRKREEAEEALRESEIRLRLALGAAQLSVFDLTIPDQQLRTFSAASSPFGLESQSSFLEAWLDSIHPEDRRVVANRFRSCLDGQVSGFNAEFRRKTEKGEWHWYQSAGGIAAWDSQGQPFRVLGIFSDISERKRAESHLKASEEKYRNYFEQNLAGTLISEPQGALLDCNPAFLRIFGFSSSEEVRRTHFQDLFPVKQGADRILETLRSEGFVEDLELEMRKRSGDPVHVLVNVMGKSDRRGELTEITSTFIDDSKRRILEDELRQVQKLDSLGTLAGGIAHDFNNLLTIIMGQVSLLQTLKVESHLFTRCVEALATAANRGAGLVRQLLTFARKSSVKMESLDLKSILKEDFKLIQETFPRNIHLSFDFADGLPPVRADRNQMYQILLNLCLNARDAMPWGGDLHVGGRLHNKVAALPGGRQRGEGDYVVLEVRDSGQGMTEEVRKRIFEPFFTTKEFGKGTGLGLSVVLGIVESHKGFLDVESVPGQGTGFKVFFPAEANREEPTTTRPRVAHEDFGGSETILLVEDEELVRELERITLENMGYEVLIALDGEEGIRLFEEHKGRIHLVFSDLGLPKLNGMGVFSRVTQIRPDIKFLLASGFVEPEQRKHLLEAGAKEILLKPFSPGEMLQMVRRVLDS